jgi:hypothetical protein
MLGYCMRKGWRQVWLGQVCIQRCVGVAAVVCLIWSIRLGAAHECHVQGSWA